jgi:hypothetical protein
VVALDFFGTVILGLNCYRTLNITLILLLQRVGVSRGVWRVSMVRRMLRNTTRHGRCWSSSRLLLEKKKQLITHAAVGEKVVEEVARLCCNADNFDGQVPRRRSRPCLYIPASIKLSMDQQDQMLSLVCLYWILYDMPAFSFLSTTSCWVGCWASPRVYQINLASIYF